MNGNGLSEIVASPDLQSVVGAAIRVDQELTILKQKNSELCEAYAKVVDKLARIAGVIADAHTRTTYGIAQDVKTIIEEV